MVFINFYLKYLIWYSPDFLGTNNLVNQSIISTKKIGSLIKYERKNPFVLLKLHNTVKVAIFNSYAVFYSMQLLGIVTVAQLCLALFYSS